ncbi:MAG: extracellular solute-binding protein [Caldilineaceae bacterium SB0664_bin_22]|nr:extracellular solute-binding protein [Caldilineaceae bacterium SB0664_bin_22]
MSLTDRRITMARHNLSRRDFMRVSGVAAGSLALAACAVAPVAPSGDMGPEAVTINFFNRGGAFIEGVMDTQMALYRESNPHVEFEINAVAGYSHQEALLLMISAGTGPDCWFDANRTTGMLTRKGVTTDLEPYLAADPTFNEDDYVPNVWIAQTYDGKRWGLPWDSGAMCLGYDKDIFDAAGLDYPAPDVWMTWDDVLELALQLTIDLDGNKPGDSGFDPARVAQYGFKPGLGHGRYTYLWANDAEIVAEDGTMPMDSDEFVQTMNWLASLGLEHYVAPSPAYETAAPVDMRSKNLAMQHIGAWSIGRINAAEVNWGTTQVPYNTTPVSYGHYSPLCVFSRSKVQQEAYDFVQFACCSFDGQKILVDLGMQQPIRKDLREQFLNNPEGPDGPSRQVFYDAFENMDTFRWPGDTIGSYFGGWYQPLLDYWAPYNDQLFLGEVRWEDIAAEVRAGSEQILATGELA